MANQKITATRTDKRWTEGSVAPCFSWSTTTTNSTKVSDDFGRTVHHEEECPNWRHLIAQGLNATTSFRASESQLTYSPGFVQMRKICQVTQRYAYRSWSGFSTQNDLIWERPVSPSQSIDSTADNAALMYAISNARARQSAFSGSTFLAELRDVIRSIRNPVRSIRAQLDTYRSRARRAAQQAAGRRTLPTTREAFAQLERENARASRAVQRALSDTYLEFQFGWIPLATDASKAYQAGLRLKYRQPLARFSGESSNDVLFSRNTVNTPFQGFNIADTQETVKRSGVRYYGAVKCEVDSPLVSTFEEFGLVTKDFVPAVWEAIPYSFLIDYFSNAGEVISALSFPRSDLAWMSRVYRNVVEKRLASSTCWQTLAFPPVGSYEELEAFYPMSVEWSYKYVSRGKYGGSTVPMLQWEIPGAKNWRRYLNIAALAHLKAL